MMSTNLVLDEVPVAIQRMGRQLLSLLNECPNLTGNQSEDLVRRLLEEPRNGTFTLVYQVTLTSYSALTVQLSPVETKRDYGSTELTYYWAVNVVWPAVAGPSDAVILQHSLNTVAIHAAAKLAGFITAVGAVRQLEEYTPDVTLH